MASLFTGTANVCSTSCLGMKWNRTPKTRIWQSSASLAICHDNVIKWKHFPRYWPFVRGIHRSPVNSPHKGQWRGALVFSLICVWINGWVNNREAGDLTRYRAHYDVSVMLGIHCDQLPSEPSCHLPTQRPVIRKLFPCLLHAPALRQYLRNFEKKNNQHKITKT